MELRIQVIHSAAWVWRQPGQNNHPIPIREIGMLAIIRFCAVIVTGGRLVRAKTFKNTAQRPQYMQKSNIPIP
jgi:hypothetical protein